MGVDYSTIMLLGWDLADIPIEMMFEIDEKELEKEYYGDIREWAWDQRHKIDDFPFEVFSVNEWWDTRGYFGVKISGHNLDYGATTHSLSDFSVELDKAIQSMKKLFKHPKITSYGETWLQENPPKIHHYVYMW